LNLLSNISSDRLKEITIPHDFALSLFGVFKESVDPLTLLHGAKLDFLQDRSAVVDLLGYSLTILRDMSHAGFGGCC
jgi:ataxin-10